MTRWECTTHKIALVIEGNKRTFETPPGSIRGMPPCKLLTINPVTEGKLGNCEIKKVS
ncbi:unnamed protein product [marine sediment metagenome]|uniref:Uncharacterized protein n=1 Tax=marine sediment metagenome TaxID=412755 RepID=X1PM82_9ZZZZ